MGGAMPSRDHRAYLFARGSYGRSWAAFLTPAVLLLALLLVGAYVPLDHAMAVQGGICAVALAFDAITFAGSCVSVRRGMRRATASLLLSGLGLIFSGGLTYLAIALHLFW